MKKKQKGSVIYVNYSPYENSGKILDYLLENFEIVILFLLNFHELGKAQKPGQLLIYRKGKIVKKYPLLDLPFRIPLFLTFILLPVRSLINLFQILYYAITLKNKYGKFNFYFTVNAFTAWIGNILKEINVIDKTIFWVWDYYPPKHENWTIRVMRKIYGFFDKIALRSDRVIFVNDRMIRLKRQIGLLIKNKKYPVVSIGTEKVKYKKNDNKDLSKVKFGFIGVLKKSQGLEIVLENAEEIIKHFPGASYEIIGSGPDENLYKKMAKSSPILVKFYGYVQDSLLNKVLSKCHIGIATYVPSESNLSAYGDPGKVKRYLTLGIPVIAPDVFEFSSVIREAKAGIIVDYYKRSELINAVRTIIENYNEYSQNAYKLGAKFYYKEIYPKLFK